jgi:hypothetical protein
MRRDAQRQIIGRSVLMGRFARDRNDVTSRTTRTVREAASVVASPPEI